MTESERTPPEEAGQPAYGQMPGYAESGPTGPPPAPPNDLNIAARLLYVIAGIGVLSTLLMFLMQDDLEEVILDRDPDLTPDELDAAVNGALVIGVIVGLVFAIIYVLLARKILQGAGWARIVATILLALAILGGVTSGAQTLPTISVILSIISAVVAVFALFMLWRRSSSDYFSAVASSRRRY